MNNFQDLFKEIKYANTIMLVCHKAPDGDAFGATTALYKALKNLNKTVEIYCEKPYNAKLSFIPNSECFSNEKLINKYDLAISLDCADISRIGEWEKLYQTAKRTVCIDHHESNPRFADYNYVSPKSSATCELLYEILEQLDSEQKCIDSEVAFSLYCGIITDSGDFKNTCTTDKTEEIAYKIRKKFNIDSKKIVYHFMDEIEHNVFLLKTRVLNKAIFNEEKTVGIICFTNEDFEKTGTDNTCTEGIINDIKNIRGIRVAAAITQIGEENYKISLRSHKDYPIVNLAIQKGGGGHDCAAGYRENGYQLDVIDQVMSDCTKYAE